MMAPSEETRQESFFQVEVILRLPDHLLETPTIIFLPPGAQDMEKIQAAWCYSVNQEEKETASISSTCCFSTAFLIQGSLTIPIIKCTLLPVSYKYTQFSQKRQMTFQSTYNNKLLLGSSNTQGWHSQLLSLILDTVLTTQKHIISKKNV